MSYLGIDLGTSGLRALLVSDQGMPIGSCSKSYGISRPHDGWSEQDPSDWIAALEGAISELRSQYPAFKNLSGIGVAGHMHGATLLGKAGEVLRPCILWNDTRSQTQAAVLDGDEKVRALSGNIVFPGFTAPKMLWVQQNEPDIFKNVAKVLLPAAYLNYYLTGEYVADMSDSAGTSWLDVGARDWSDYLLDAGHMRCDQMPRLVDGSQPAGTLRSALKADWGLSQTVTVAGGAGDNAAAACGIGAMREGQGFVSLGTSGVLLAARDGYFPAPETAVHTFCHSVPDQWYQMGVMLCATDSLNWLSGILGESPSALTSALGDDLRAPTGVRFLPYLSGERTPHNDANIRGSFTGLTTRTTRADMTQAVLEGVAFGLRDSFDALTAADAKLETLFAIGGGAASKYWLRLLATVLDIPLQLPASGEFGAALGAARLGMMADGIGALGDVMTPPKVQETINPVGDMTEVVMQSHHAFKKAYSGIKAIQ
jgi:xylulokinase